MLDESVVAVRERLQGSLWLSDLPAMLGWAALVGVLGAGTTIGFHAGIHFLQNLATGNSGSIVQVIGGLPWYGRLLFPVVGGVAAGGLQWAASKVKVASNASDYMEAVAIGDGRLSIRRGLLRSLSSLATVASGGSIGREGAMVHLSSLSASTIGRLTYFNTARLRLLVACGASAGVAAAYGAPIAGALFVAEIILGTMTMQSFGPLLIAAASANITMRATGHYQTTYAMGDVPQLEPAEILLFIVLGVLVGVVAPQFLKLLALSRKLFKATRLPLTARLALGGLLLGLLLTQMPVVAGNGYSVVYSLLHSQWTWTAVVLILVSKVLATALTVGSGAIGGVFTPSLFVGAAFGTLFAQVIAFFLPHLATHPHLFTLVGMGAFLGAATSAPLMAILMIFEMTLSYQIVLPLILACVVAYFVSRRTARIAMYDVTLARDRDLRLRHELRHTALSDLIRPPETVISTDAPVRDALQMFIEYPVNYIYVVDEEDVYQGVIVQQDLTTLLLNDRDAQKKLASEVLRFNHVKVLHPDMTIDDAQAHFVQFEDERLPVVGRGERPKLLGVVYKSSLLEKFFALKKSMDASGEAMLDVEVNRRAG